MTDVLYGASPSLYTGKARSYLRKQGIELRASIALWAQVVTPSSACSVCATPTDRQRRRRHLHARNARPPAGSESAIYARLAFRQSHLRRGDGGALGYVDDLRDPIEVLRAGAGRIGFGDTTADQLDRT